MATDSGGRSGPELVLGTVQLGLNYGVTNTSGEPDEAAVRDILDKASAVGIRSLDTARAYGSSEAKIGQYLRTGRPEHSFEVLTKTDPAIGASTDANGVATATHASLAASRAALGQERLDCVMLHRPEHLTSGGGAVVQVLLMEQSAGRVGRIGVSLSEPDELLTVLDRPEITHVQVPFNLLDHRFEREDLRTKLAARPDVRVHIRSAFLQGLIVAAGAEQLVALFGQTGAAMASFFEALPELSGQPDRVHAALAYVRASSWIDGVVVGAATSQELAQTAAAFQAGFDPTRMAEIRERRPHLGAEILNPALWPRQET